MFRRCRWKVGVTSCCLCVKARGWHNTLLGCLRSGTQTTLQAQHSQHLPNRLWSQRQPDPSQRRGVASIPKGQRLFMHMWVRFLFIEWDRFNQLKIFFFFKAFDYKQLCEVFLPWLFALLVLIFYLHLLRFLCLVKKLWTSVWNALAIYTAIIFPFFFFITLIKRRLSESWNVQRWRPSKHVPALDGTTAPLVIFI